MRVVLPVDVEFSDVSVGEGECHLLLYRLEPVFFFFFFSYVSGSVPAICMLYLT